MSIKHDLPGHDRMMMPFDQGFLKMIPVFKKGFKGIDEMGEMQVEIGRTNLKSRENLSFLDVGSADGEWLKKTMANVWRQAEFPDGKFTALDPIANNGDLAKLCAEKGVKHVPKTVEGSNLDSDSFDIITSTHTAYYFYNQPFAHEELHRILRPGGLLIVTLVSQFCVLNKLTESLLEDHKQCTLNAESYITLMSKLGMFQLEKAILFSGGSMDHDFYLNDPNKNLSALATVLARHRLPHYEVEESLKKFGETLKRTRAMERKNLIMFFRKKANGLSTEVQRQDSQRHLRKRKVDQAIFDLQSELLALPESMPEIERDLLGSCLRTFSNYAISESNVTKAYLNHLSEDLLGIVQRNEGPLNEIQKRLDEVIELAVGDSPAK